MVEASGLLRTHLKGFTLIVKGLRSHTELAMNGC